MLKIAICRYRLAAIIMLLLPTLLQAQVIQINAKNNSVDYEKLATIEV